MDYAIDVSHLSKSFHGKTAVIDVSLKVKKGEIFGFLGPNGSGKTTTIRMLCGLLTPDKGSGTCLNYDIYKQAELIKLNIGYMTQRFSLYDDLTIRENLDFIARVYDLAEREAKVQRAIDDLGMKNRSQQLAGELSGGWKQRLALSAALLHEPQLLLLDEPTAGVDPEARREFWDEIHHLASRGITTLVSTHYMDEAERCNRLAYIANGNMLVTGTPQEIIDHSGLIVWATSGENLSALANKLKNLAGIEQVNVLGDSLHVVGHEAEILQKSLSAFQTDEWHWQKIKPSLEEVFISLSQFNRDKRYG